jgi:hypothetical protein
MKLRIKYAAIGLIAVISSLQVNAQSQDTDTSAILLKQAKAMQQVAALPTVGLGTDGNVINWDIRVKEIAGVSSTYASTSPNLSAAQCDAINNHRNKINGVPVLIDLPMMVKKAGNAFGIGEDERGKDGSISCSATDKGGFQLVVKVK